MYKKINLIIAILIAASINLSAQDKTATKGRKVQKITFTKFLLSFDDIKDNMVLISNDKDVIGSGFVAEMSGKIYVFTNLNMVKNLEKFTIKDIDGNILKPISYEIAPKQNILRIKLQKEGGIPLVFANEVPVKTPIVFYHNIMDPKKVKEVYGLVIRSDKDRIFVASHFVPQKPGGPILNREKKVLGIATHVLANKPKDSSEKDAKLKAMGILGFKITPEMEWQEVSWSQYIALKKRITEDKIFLQILKNVHKGWEQNAYRKFKLHEKAPKDLKSWVNYHNKEMDKNDKEMKRLKLKEEKGNLRLKDVDNLVAKMRKSIEKGGKHLNRWCETRIREITYMQRKSKSKTSFDKQLNEIKESYKTLAKEFTEATKIQAEKTPIKAQKKK